MKSLYEIVVNKIIDEIESILKKNLLFLPQGFCSKIHSKYKNKSLSLESIIKLKNFIDSNPLIVKRDEIKDFVELNYFISTVSLSNIHIVDFKRFNLLSNICTSLSLINVGLRDEDLIIISKMKKLQLLDIRNNYRISLLGIINIVRPTIVPLQSLSVSFPLVDCPTKDNSRVIIEKIINILSTIKTFSTLTINYENIDLLGEILKNKNVLIFPANNDFDQKLPRNARFYLNEVNH